MNFRMTLRGKIFLYIFLVLIAVITLTPLIYTAGASLKTNK